METSDGNSLMKSDAGMVEYSLSWREVEHAFARPVVTAHGTWRTRHTILLRLDAEGRHGYGEAAPITAFGSPEISECASCLRGLGRRIDRETALSSNFPGVLRFAFGSAVAMLEGRQPRFGHWPLSRLLPPGPDALFVAGRWIRLGARSFKYKLRGVPDAEERDVLGILFDILKASGGKLRIDCNEGLNVRNAAKCLSWLSEEGGAALDYVEQPLKRGREDAMRSLAGRTGVAVALDESVSAAPDLERLIDWAGPLVIKPALVGSPDEVAAILQKRAGRTVFSSAFESPVGLWGCLLASGGRAPEPLGFGVDVWPEGDVWGTYTHGASVDPRRITMNDLDALWIGLFR